MKTKQHGEAYKSFVNLLIFVMVITLGLLTLYNYNVSKVTTHNLRRSIPTVFKKPRHMIPFNLIDETGQTFTNKNLLGQWTFLFFGSTHCSHACTKMILTASKMYRNLKRREVKQLPQVIMISINPAQDSPKKIRAYLQPFNEAFKGVTGNKATLDKLANQLDREYKKMATDKQRKGYNIKYANSILLINPQGKLIVFFTSPHSSIQLIKIFLEISQQKTV